MVTARELTLLSVFVACALTMPHRGRAQATPYVPLESAHYADVDALAAVGLVKTVIAGQRPYSRLMFARLATEARSNLDRRTDATPSRRFLEAVKRLEDAYSLEARVGATLRSVNSDATLASSPPRSVRSSYDTDDPNGRIDALVNPLLQRNRGRRLADGGTLAAEAQLDLILGTRLAGQLRPRVWVSDDGEGAQVTLVGGYLRGLLGNLSIEAGRNHSSHGHGSDAGSILSSNARGLDMIRFSLDRPARLPGFLRGLGPVLVSARLADLGGTSDTPHSKLVVFELSLRPHPNLELGTTLLNHQGGRGAPPATLLQRLQDLFLIYPQGAEISDKVMGADLRWTLPALQAQVSVEVFTTDDHEFFKDASEALGSEAVWVIGAKRFGLGSAGRFDIWVEGKKAGVRPHTHHQFTSGLTLDGRVIGDPLGPLATALATGMDWRGPFTTVSISGVWERYSGDVYDEIRGDGRFAWDKIADLPDEVRKRVVGTWTSDTGERGLTKAVRIGVEAVERFAFSNERRTNFLAQLLLGYRW